VPFPAKFNVVLRLTKNRFYFIQCKFIAILWFKIKSQSDPINAFNAIINANQEQYLFPLAARDSTMYVCLLIRQVERNDIGSIP
jgi:hypothetical protein